MQVLLVMQNESYKSFCWNKYHCPKYQRWLQNQIAQKCFKFMISAHQFLMCIANKFSRPNKSLLYSSKWKASLYITVKRQCVQIRFVPFTHTHTHTHVIQAKYKNGWVSNKHVNAPNVCLFKYVPRKQDQIRANDEFIKFVCEEPSLSMSRTTSSK